LHFPASRPLLFAYGWDAGTQPAAKGYGFRRFHRMLIEVITVQEVKSPSIEGKDCSSR
jgi:hypothetical protein